MHTTIVMFIVAQYELVAEKQKCTGDAAPKGILATVEECGVQCTNVASMFQYALAEGAACEPDGCFCVCMLDASADGTCTQESDINFNLYRFNTTGKKLYIKYFQNSLT